MITFFKIIISKIKFPKFLKDWHSKMMESLRDKNGHISHTRISSYYILLSILITDIAFLSIDVVNAYIAWSAGNEYVIPWEHIAIFTAILSHHLVLLGLKKSEEKVTSEMDKKYPEQSRRKRNEDNSGDMPPNDDIEIK